MRQSVHLNTNFFITLYITPNISVAAVFNLSNVHEENKNKRLAPL
ncbi:hypothetical protein HMPREF9151_01867 [Hoylesella saccharolytica F0055]|uniref:Uncharacterized protein n=1 Tax=Hoylesella saccharolytica F0055 TaxID=1127699 RepID=L1N5W0_9BACT|nr:hypothetical protein HMPREF9151_01867 [Hoylesella saccharolytica F0055]